MRTAAFFDLDGTLLAVNSGVLWVRSERRAGRMPLALTARAAALVAGYRFGIVDIENATLAALSTVRGLEEDVLRERTLSWWRDEVAARAAPGAPDVVRAHRERGELLVLLTSSSAYASEAAVRQFGLDAYLCTRYEIVDGRFTGKPVRPLCFGPGKVSAAEAFAAHHGIDLAKSSFHTDSCTDLPMLLRVGRPHAVNPDPRLRWNARRRGWPVHDWRRAGRA